jgi:hypothetical protein
MSTRIIPTLRRASPDLPLADLRKLVREKDKEKEEREKAKKT